MKRWWSRYGIRVTAVYTVPESKRNISKRCGECGSEAMESWRMGQVNYAEDVVEFEPN